MRSARSIISPFNSKQVLTRHELRDVEAQKFIVKFLNEKFCSFSNEIPRFRNSSSQHFQAIYVF